MKIREFVVDYDLEKILENVVDLGRVRRRLEKEVQILDKKFSQIDGCKVVFDLPFRPRFPKNTCDLKIDIILANRRIRAVRSLPFDGNSAVIFSVIRDAFEEIETQLDVQRPYRSQPSASLSALY